MWELERKEMGGKKESKGNRGKEKKEKEKNV